ncbi:hypothetical protein E2C01_009100 [Portunus trituberculatus]|uniref:Uncharacterized protein n=1 Tax=Portunus trituberculatus TaxID=210409 RepID=A0A5B7D3S5_PORTR|nr:hypothetical protein [Portunus trituberculatus]
MRLPLDLATVRTLEEELPQTAYELVVTLQQRMEATRDRKRGTTLKSLENYWNVGRPYTALQRLAAVTYKLDIATSKRWRIVHVDRRWAVVEEGYLWGQQGLPSSPDK